MAAESPENKTLVDLLSRLIKGEELSAEELTLFQSLSKGIWEAGEKAKSSWWHPGKNYADLSGTTKFYKGYRHVKDMLTTPFYAGIGAVAGYELMGPFGIVLGSSLGSAYAYNRLGFSRVQAAGKGYLAASRASVYGAAGTLGFMGMYKLAHTEPSTIGSYLIEQIPTVSLLAGLRYFEKKADLNVSPYLGKSIDFLAKQSGKFAKILKPTVKYGLRFGMYELFRGLTTGETSGFTGTAVLSAIGLGSYAMHNLIKSEGSIGEKFSKTLAEHKNIKSISKKVAKTVLKHPALAAVTAVLGSALLSNVATVGKYTATESGPIPRPIGMDPNYLNSGQMALASHYAASTYSRRR